MNQCRACGAKLQPGNRFCANCGEPIPSQGTIDPQPMAVGADRTVVDSQLIGYLVIESGAARGKMFPLRGTLRIGRTGDNDIVLGDPLVSSSHAIVHQEGTDYVLRDLGSTNGTFLNETQLFQPQKLREGDRIRMGVTRLVFKWMPASAGSMAAHGHPPYAAVATPVAAPPGPPPVHTPPQPVMTQRPSWLPTGLKILGGALLVLAVAITAVAIYILVVKPETGLLSRGGDETPASVITVVVTSEPGTVATPPAQPATATADVATAPATVTAEPTTAPATATAEPTTAPATATPLIAPTATIPAATAVTGPQEMISFHSNRDGNWEIYVIDPDGSNVKRLSDNEVLDAALSWSPDGQRATFTSELSGNRDVYVMNADGSGMINISNDPAVDSDSSWSPDGSKIAFESARSGDYEIWVANADGSNPANLTNTEGGDGKPVWSPDGTKIAFESARDGNVEVYVMNADGSGQTNLTNNPATDQRPQWSPDGRQIAFHTDRDGNLEVYIMNADGSNPVNLSNNAAEDRQPIWSPDGERIAFNSNRGAAYAIHIMHHDGSNVIELSGEGSSWATDWSLVDLTAAPQPLPTQTPPQGFSLPYNEDFSDPNSGWIVTADEKRIQEYKDGEYQVTVLVDDYSTWSYVPDATLSDFSAEVDIKQLSDVEDGAWGLLFRYVDQDNWYRVRFSPKGTFEVKKKVNGSFIPIQNWTSSEAILTGQATNHLKVICKGDQIAAFVNGQHLTTVRDLTFEEGRLALITQTFSGKPNVKVAFDNLQLTVAEDVPPPVLGPLPLVDDFGNDGSGWPTADTDDADYGYRDGTYYFRTKLANRLYRVPLPDRVYADFSMEVDATLVEGPDAGYYGVIFRFVSHDDQYLFRLSADGRIRLDKKAAGEYTTLVPWQESSAVNTGQATNHLRIVCQGTQCSVYVNDQQVATINDDTFLQGKIGFVVGNPQDAGGTTIQYDNLSINAP